MLLNCECLINQEKRTFLFIEPEVNRISLQCRLAPFPVVLFLNGTGSIHIHWEMLITAWSYDNQQSLLANESPHYIQIQYFICGSPPPEIPWRWLTVLVRLHKHNVEAAHWRLKESAVVAHSVLLTLWSMGGVRRRFLSVWKSSSLSTLVLKESCSFTESFEARDAGFLAWWSFSEWQKSNISRTSEPCNRLNCPHM